MGDGEAVLLMAGRKIMAKDMAGRKVRQECGGKEDKFARERVTALHVDTDG
jgi:hypothetical protein